MMLRVYNTLSRSKEEFVPLEENAVRMYVCGPTVYDYPHIGNARSFCVFDTIRRFLEYMGYRVTYVTNFTDIDDKMINRANEEGVTVAELAAKFIAEYKIIARQLNLKPATVNPRATEHIDDIIEMVSLIIKNGKGYVVDGDVYFDVSEMKTYGVLSRISPEELSAGARVDVDEKKQDPRDFALWKAEKPGEPSWDSPWGKGRPGWHAECSVMGRHYLGLPFDIHGGGQDLIFPHHENEIAQSAAAYGIETPVKYWLHNGFLTINADKMSKSEGNFSTAREVLDNYDHQAVRFYLISGHYRQPLDYNDGAMKQAIQSLERIKNAVDTVQGRIDILEKIGSRETEADKKLAEAIEKVKQGFEREMSDDFNTPGAIAEIFTFVREINTLVGEVGGAAVLRETLAVLSELVGILGINLAGEGGEGDGKAAEALKGVVEYLLEMREEARAAKDYARADAIRDRLASLGISIADTKDGPTWKLE
ncbi:MAG: cysteine--tRNA ligase [Candidatus Thorarchaeota archaeon]|nr:MAG: cysteine--tRNA ligase [Candidatus Thorarchaeota archaeon]RLI58269.1 MAG: cysteine--tRNA ligase [Candidatus Thorarchaeota archaeon]